MTDCAAFDLFGFIAALHGEALRQCANAQTAYQIAADLERVAKASGEPGEGYWNRRYQAEQKWHATQRVERALSAAQAALLEQKLYEGVG